MPINNVNRIFLGNEEIVKAYLGSEQIYPNTEPFYAQFDLSKGTSSTTLTLPFTTPASYSNLTIDWGDGTTTTGSNSHTYDTIGVYDVKIYGQVRDFRYNNTNQPQKLMRIFNWGQFIITRDAVFNGCSNLIIEDLETKVNVETNDIRNMFVNCSSITAIPLLDTSKITNMQSMFRSCSALTTIPAELDTSKVTDMRFMFYECSVLDVDLSGWCVPLITSLPTNFVTGAPLMTSKKLPVWRTCP